MKRKKYRRYSRISIEILSLYEGLISLYKKSYRNNRDEYITPEGKFDVILFGKQTYNNETKKAIKEYVFEFDGEYPAKDSIGLFDSLEGNTIPNDLSIIEELTKDK